MSFPQTVSMPTAMVWGPDDRLYVSELDGTIHATAQVLDGVIYVAGGLDAGGASLDVVEIYDPVADSWSTAAPLGTRRDNAGSAVLDGKLYVFGGRTRNANGSVVDGTLATVEMFDALTEAWTARASMPTGRRTFGVGTLGGRAQVFGGEATPLGSTFAQNEEYDPATDTWRTLAPMQTPRHGVATATIGGAIYAAGGGIVAGSSFSDTVEVFAFATGP